MTEQQKRRRFKMFFTWFTILAMVGLAYLLRAQIAETIQNLGKVNAWVLLALIPLHITSYYSQGKLYQGIFRALGERFRTKSMYRLTLELNFINNVFPSGGVSGFSYLPIRLKDEGITTGQATLVQLMRFMTIFTGFQVLLFVGVFMLSLHGEVNNLTILAASSLTTLLLVGTAVLAYIIGNKARIKAFFTFVTKAVNLVIHVVRPNHPETINISRAQASFLELHHNYMMIRRDISKLKRPFLFGLGFSLAELAAIYVVYIAFGELVNPGAIIIAYAIANFAGIISVLPGGIGIYEALMTGVLVAAGVPASVSLPVTIMYRVLNMAIALPQGGWLYYRALHGKPVKLDA
jgi:uncharacterized protein (TIRG00374 family)